MNINLNNYNVVKMFDNYDWTITGAILLNNKHDIDDFRDAIKQAKIKRIWLRLGLYRARIR